MSNSQIELLIIKIVQVMLDAVKGVDAPYNYSKLVSEIKKKYPDFPKNLELSKSSEFVDILISKGLVAKAFPKGKTNLYLQPLIPLNQWILSISNLSVDDNLFYANPIAIPSVKFDNWASFLDFIDRYQDTPRFSGKLQVKSSNFVEYKTFSIILESVCYFTEKFDFEKISQIRELISFGMTYQNRNNYASNINLNVISVLEDYNRRQDNYTYNQRYGYNRQMTNNIYHKNYPNISIKLSRDRPYQNYMAMKNKGFYSIEHFTEAAETGLFNPDLLEKYKSEKFEKLKPEDRRIAVLAGFADSTEFNKARSNGFIYAEEYRDSLKGGFSDCSQYREATNLGYDNRDSFVKASKLGYRNKNDFVEGQKLGFHDAKEYYDAINTGFKNVDEYRDALSVNIRDKRSYDRWISQRDKRIKSIKPILIGIIETFKDDSYSLTKIHEFIKHQDRNFSLSDLEYLLSTDNDFRELGTYREDVKIFIKGKQRLNQIKVNNKNNRNKVVVDGSNVAHHGKSEKNTDPQIENIDLMIKALENRNIPFVFYVRSNLKYQIDNREKFEKLLSKGKIVELPAGAEDDEYILKHAITTGSKIISNDRFRDYQKENPKLADTIRESTVTFDIVDSLVTFSDLLDDWLKTPNKRKKRKN